MKFIISMALVTGLVTWLSAGHGGMEVATMGIYAIAGCIIVGVAYMVISTLSAK